MTPDIKNVQRLPAGFGKSVSRGGESPVTVLGREALKLKKASLGTSVEPTVLPYFTHSLVEIVMVADLVSGGISTRNRIMNGNGGFNEGNSDTYIFWDQRYQGVEASSANMARFLADAARLLDEHNTAIKAARMAGEKLLCH